MAGWIAVLRTAVIGAIALMVLLSTGAPAVAAPPTLEVGPAELVLAPGEQAQVQLVVRNDGDVPTVVDQVTAGAVEGLRITLPAPSAFGSVAAKSAVPATVLVEATAEFAGGTVPISVVGRQPEQFVAVATLSVTARPPDPGLAVTVIGAPETIGDGETRPVIVQVTNPSAHVWSMLTLRATGSESLCLTLPETGSCPSGMALAAIPLAASIGPGAMVEQALTLHAVDSVRPGRQAISVVAAAERPSTPLTRTVGTAELTATTTVFGLDLLSPFGLTTLLLVPGTVALLTFQLSRRVLRGPAVGPADLDIKDPGALLFIVPVGVLVYLAALAVLNRDLRGDVSSADVTLLFLTGVVIGVLVAAAWWCRWWWVVGRKTFRPGDSPATVVRRLVRRRGSLLQPTTTINGAEFQVLAEGDGRRVVCPRVAYRYRAGLDATGRGAFAGAADNLDVPAVWAAVKRGDVELGWVASAGPSGVADLESTGGLNPARHLLVQDPGG